MILNPFLKVFQKRHLRVLCTFSTIHPKMFLVHVASSFGLGIRNIRVQLGSPISLCFPIAHPYPHLHPRPHRQHHCTAVFPGGRGLQHRTTDALQQWSTAAPQPRSTSPRQCDVSALWASHGTRTSLAVATAEMPSRCLSLTPPPPRLQMANDVWLDFEKFGGVHLCVQYFYWPLHEPRLGSIQDPDYADMSMKDAYLHQVPRLNLPFRDPYGPNCIDAISAIRPEGVLLTEAQPRTGLCCVVVGESASLGGIVLFALEMAENAADPTTGGHNGQLNAHVQEAHEGHHPTLDTGLAFPPFHTATPFSFLLFFSPFDASVAWQSLVLHE